MMSYYVYMPPTELFIKRLRHEFSVAPDVEISPDTDFYQLIGDNQANTLIQLQLRLGDIIGTTPDKATDYFITGMQAASLGDGSEDSGVPNTVGRLFAMITFIHKQAMPDNMGD
jgi:hypothetical protein